MDPLVAELNVTTREEIYPSALEDQFFVASPLLAYYKNEGLHEFGGGSRMQTSFLYRPGIGGAYKIGDQFNTTRVSALSAMQFDPKYYYASVVEFKEIIQVLNIGPLAVYSIIDVDMHNAMQTINAIVAISLYRHGQNYSASNNREEYVNGLSEAINDGVNNSWDGTLATGYGKHTRNGVVGSTLNSVPLWLGDAAGNPGPLTYNAMLSGYTDVSIGADQPNLIVVNKAGNTFALQRMQPQQRFAQEQDPYWGAYGWRFMKAMVLVDEYCPSLAYGESHAVLGSYLTAGFTTASTTTAKSRLPASTAITPAEVMFMFNTRTHMFRMSNDAEFGFGFSGFIPSQFDNKIAGRINAAINLEIIAPRLNKQIFGFNS